MLCLSSIALHKRSGRETGRGRKVFISGHAATVIIIFLLKENSKRCLSAKAYYTIDTFVTGYNKGIQG